MTEVEHPRELSLRSKITFLTCTNLKSVTTNPRGMYVPYAQHHGIATLSRTLFYELTTFSMYLMSNNS